MSNLESNFYRIQFTAVPKELEEELSELCFSFGSSGVAQNLAFQQPDLVYEAQAVATDEVHFDAYFLKEPQVELLHQLRARYGSIQFDLTQEAPRDWLAEWKKGFKAFCLVDRYWVVPSWLTAPEGEEIVPISIDPGMAFGTGTHATTQLAAELIFDQSRMVGARLGNVLDVGTGTGILALLSEHLGAQSVTAIDNDPEALRVCRENLETNHSQKITVPPTQVDQLTKSYDLVIVNIIDGILLKIRESLMNLTASGGALIVSGILREHEEDFLVSFSRADFEVCDRRERDGWVALRLLRSPKN